MMSDFPKRSLYFAKIYEMERLWFAMLNRLVKSCFCACKACRIFDNNRVVTRLVCL